MCKSCGCQRLTRCVIVAACDSEMGGGLGVGGDRWDVGVEWCGGAKRPRWLGGERFGGWWMGVKELVAYRGKLQHRSRWWYARAVAAHATAASVRSFQWGRGRVGTRYNIDSAPLASVHIIITCNLRGLRTTAFFAVTHYRRSVAHRRFSVIRYVLVL